MLLVTGKLGKHIKFLTFCFHDQRNSRHLVKLGAWRAAKTRACLLRCSFLNTFPRIQCVI